MADDVLREHPCVDCREGPEAPSRPRPLADGTNRCATHLRAFRTRQRKQARARQVERTYDITAADNHELFLFQGGRCWLCRKATGATKSLAVDHDHATDEVRGRLCGPCNRFIGTLGDDPEAARRLVAYLSGDTPYRRLKAKQVIDAATQLSSEIVSVTAIGDELFAYWRFEGASVWNQWLVRRADGVWSTERVTS